MTEILAVVIEAGLLLVAIIAFLIPLLDSQRKKQEAAVKALVNAIVKDLQEAKERWDKESTELRSALVKEHAERDERVSRLHTRIDEMQKELIGDMRSDMSEIKGQLKGVSNIMTQIQGWFIDQAWQSKPKGV